MNLCAVMHCTVETGTKRDHETGMFFCPFHLQWFTTRYDSRPEVEHHARHRWEDVRLMRRDPAELHRRGAA
jgi:hypothetical protein